MSALRFAEDGWTVVVATWQPYAVLVLGVTGLLLVQSAFEMAPLRMSLPALTAAQPIAGIVCGVGFLGDRLRTDPLALLGEVVGLLAVVGGIVLLGLHPAMPRGAGRFERAGELHGG